MVSETLIEMRKAFYKIYKVVESCENSLHFQATIKLINLFFRKYRDEDNLILRESIKYELMEHYALLNRALENKKKSLKT